MTTYDDNCIYVIRSSSNRFYKFYQRGIYLTKDSIEEALAELSPFGRTNYESSEYLNSKQIVAIYNSNDYPELFI